MLGFAGVTAIETSGASFTVNVELPETDASVACMVVIPVPRLLANPELPTEATSGFDEVQVTCEVSICLLASLYIPVAVNC